MRFILILAIMFGFTTSSFAAKKKSKIVAASVSKKVAKKTAMKSASKPKKMHAKKRMSEKERKALAWSQVVHARKIASIRKAKEEAQARDQGSLLVADRVLPQPAVDVTDQPGDVINISEAEINEEEM
jgi:hypothetical protein